MLWKLTLQDLPGIGKKIIELNEGLYKGIPYKVHTISDIKPEDIDKLPRESALALRYLDGHPFSREDLEEFKSKYNLFAKYLILDVASYVELQEELSNNENIEDDEIEIDREHIYYEGKYNTYVIACVQTIDQIIIELR